MVAAGADIAAAVAVTWVAAVAVTLVAVVAVTLVAEVVGTLVAAVGTSAGSAADIPVASVADMLAAAASAEDRPEAFAVAVRLRRFRTALAGAAEHDRFRRLPHSIMHRQAGIRTLAVCIKELAARKLRGFRPRRLINREPDSPVQRRIIKVPRPRSAGAIRRHTIPALLNDIPSVRRPTRMPVR
jgi:hypothetical protein